MNELAPKIVFAGPVGAGKSTAIEAISDAPPVGTEVPLISPGNADLGLSEDKHTTTLALDFSTVRLEDGTVVQVFGLPGQDDLSFMRPILLTGAIGVILLLNGASSRLCQDCDRWLASLAGIDGSMPVVIGITQTDRSAEFSLSAVRDIVGRHDARIPVLTLDARNAGQSRQLLRAMLANALAIDD